MSDGKLQFETEIEDSGFAQAQKDMQAAVKETDATVKELDQDLQKAGSRRMPSADLETLQKRLADAESVLAGYRQKMESIQNTAKNGSLMPGVGDEDPKTIANLKSLDRRINSKEQQIAKLKRRIEQLSDKKVTVDADTKPAEEKIGQVDGKLSSKISPLTKKLKVGIGEAFDDAADASSRAAASMQRDAKKAARAYGNLGSGLSSLKTSFANLGKIAAGAFTLRAIVGYGKQAVTLASDLQEVQNVVDTAFGALSSQMEAFAADSVQQFGISALTAKQTGSTYMAMASGMGIAKDTAAEMSLALTGLSADMSSFYNKSQDITSTALNSTFTGETETLKQFGIVMTEANLAAFAMQQGITKSISAMTQAEKVQLRYQFVMQQTALAQGDFAKTSGNWANQLRILSEQWKQLSGIVGSALIQTLTPAIQVTNAALTKLIGYANLAYNTLAELFGWESQAASGVAASISAAVDEQNALTDAVEATTAAQEAQLAGFDKITKLSAGTGGSGAIGSASSSAEATQAADAAVTQAADQLPDLPDFDFSNLQESLENLKENALPLFGRIGNAFVWLYDEVLVPCGEWTIEEALPAGLDVLSGALNLLESAITALEPYTSVLWDEILEPYAKWSRGLVVTGLEQSAKLLNEMADWIDRMNETGELEPFLAYWVEENEAAIEDFFNTTTFAEKWNNLWQDVGEITFDVINAEKTKMNNFCKFWDYFWQEVGSTAYDAFSIIGSDMKALGGHLKNGAKNDLNTVIDLLNGMVGAFEDAANALIGGINKISFDIPTWVPGIGGNSFGMDIPKINIPDIPRLATGTVVPANFGEFLAVLGDNKREAEIVSPVSAIEQAMRNVLGSVPTQSGDIHLVVQLDGQEIYKTVVRRAQQSKMMTGSNPLAAL